MYNWLKNTYVKGVGIANPLSYIYKVNKKETMQHELEQERKYLVKLMNQAFDDVEMQKYAREMLCLLKYRNTSQNHNLSKEMVDSWNAHLDFDLHDKLERYGYIGSARLYKIFIKNN